MEAKNILGISPGTRTLGLAVFRSGRLIEWAVKDFKGPWDRDKLKSILKTLDRLLFYHQITAIVLQKPDPLRSSQQLDMLASGILREAKKRHVQIKQYAHYELWFFCEKEGLSRRNCIAEYVLGKYSHLRAEYLKERNNKRPYYGKMFEAIILVEMSRKIENS